MIVGDPEEEETKKKGSSDEECLPLFTPLSAPERDPAQRKPCAVRRVHPLRVASVWLFTAYFVPLFLPPLNNGSVQCLAVGAARAGRIAAPVRPVSRASRIPGQDNLDVNAHVPTSRRLGV